MYSNILLVAESSYSPINWHPIVPFYKDFLHNYFTNNIKGKYTMVVLTHSTVRTILGRADWICSAPLMIVINCDFYSYIV